MTVIAAYKGLITNIMTMQPIIPIPVVFPEKYLKDGLKLGAEVNVSEKHAKLMAK